MTLNGIASSGRPWAKNKGSWGPRQKTIQRVKGQTCSIVIQGKGEREKSNTSRAIAVGNQTRKNPARGQNWNAKSGDRESGLRETQTLSVSTSFRRGWRMVRAGGGAGHPADMAKSWLGLLQRLCHAGDGNGGIQVQGKRVPGSVLFKGLAGAIFSLNRRFSQTTDMRSCGTDPTNAT
jgi:hypothetical protein